SLAQPYWSIASVNVMGRGRRPSTKSGAIWPDRCVMNRRPAMPSNPAAERTTELCPWCDGSGKHSWGNPKAPLETCSFCEGTGYLRLTLVLAIQESHGGAK